jgi:PDZ domain/Aspartyl protease
MKKLWSGSMLAMLCLASLGADAPRPDAPSFEVPYRLTIPKHILVRAKLNGKGPFNFILDTGAPALFVSTKIADKVGVKSDKKGWGAFDRLEIEGGVVLKNAKARIEDPFQLEGMNGLGLAGAELHGVIGYNILARYRMEIDFTRDKMVWTPLDFEPVAPRGMGGKGGQGGMEIVGSIMKMAGAFLGTTTTPEVRLPGYLGIELTEDKDEQSGVTVRAVLADGPAGKAGLKVGDKLIKVQNRTVISIQDVQHHARKLSPGQSIKLTVERGKDTREITFKTGEGL